MTKVTTETSGRLVIIKDCFPFGYLAENDRLTTFRLGITCIRQMMWANVCLCIVAEE